MNSPTSSFFIAELTGDATLRRRVRREIDQRAHSLPTWLSELHHARPVDRVREITHVLGDGDNIILGVRLPGGQDVTATIYIDHNMGTLVKDAFLVPMPPDQLVEQMLAVKGTSDVRASDLDPADARARITDAIELASITFPPFETDTWPSCQPLVEWVVAMLPEGGIGYRRPEWDDKDLATLTERFLTSRFGARFDDVDHRGLLKSLLWFGTDYGPGDPLRWSPPSVEILLDDWIPRKIVAESTYLAKAPDLLRAFIRFCHDERGIPPELTAETLDAVNSCEPDYQQTIRSPRPQGPAALLAAMGVLDQGKPWFDGEPLDEHYMPHELRVTVGRNELEGLDADPPT